MSKYRIVKVESYKNAPVFRIEIGTINVPGTGIVNAGNTIWEPLYTNMGLRLRNVHGTLEAAEAELNEFIARKTAYKETVVKEITG